MKTLTISVLMMFAIQASAGSCLKESQALDAAIFEQTNSTYQALSFSYEVFDFIRNVGRTLDTRRDQQVGEIGNELKKNGEIALDGWMEQRNKINNKIELVNLAQLNLSACLKKLN